jgi:hypothetical protein
MFAEESATLIQKTLEKYADNMMYAFRSGFRSFFIVCAAPPPQLRHNYQNMLEKLSKKSRLRRMGRGWQPTHLAPLRVLFLTPSYMSMVRWDRVMTLFLDLAWAIMRLPKVSVKVKYLRSSGSVLRKSISED